jgi:hypothetical protein
LADAEKKEAELNNANALYRLALDRDYQEKKMEKEEALKAQARAAVIAENQAKAELQGILTAIKEAELARNKAADDAKIAYEKELAAIEEAKQKAYAETIKEIMSAVDPALVAALTAKANADMLADATKHMSPIALAKGESVADTVDTLLRGTTLEGFIKNINKNN